MWKARTGRRWWRYPLAVEWALERFVYRLRGLALFDLLELAGKLTVLVAVIFWFLEADNRAKERHYRAWELINAARGSTGDGGRRDALQDLNKDGVSLAAAPLEQAYLPGVDLKRASLWHANLKDANLQGANLWGADLVGANLEGAHLGWANLIRAHLVEANLQDAYIWGALIMGADLAGAKLMGADLGNANLWGARLEGANLQGATFGDPLMYASWRALPGADPNEDWKANLQDANLQDANLQDANLQETRNLTQEQLDAAWGDDRTVLPAGLSRPARWTKAEAPETPPPAQPDDAEPAPAAPDTPGSGK